MTPPPLVQAAQELLQFLKAQDRAACVIGGMVVARWGEPRGTQDVDATVLVDFGEELAVLELLLSKFRECRRVGPCTRDESVRLHSMASPRWLASPCEVGYATGGLDRYAARNENFVPVASSA
jgi:hypothetical protein